MVGADVLCAPSLWGESFGMVLLEGSAAGCALVASDIEGYRKTVVGFMPLGPSGRRRGAGPPRWAWPSLTPSRAAAIPRQKLARPASEYARTWSMDTLAERYVEVYGRAVEAYGAGRVADRD